MKTLSGIGVSSGYAVGKAVVIEEIERDLNSAVYTTAEGEIKKFQDAVSVYTKNTRELIDELTKTAGKKNADI